VRLIIFLHNNCSLFLGALSTWKLLSGNKDV
jgi:hypothetical protein